MIYDIYSRQLNSDDEKAQLFTHTKKYLAQVCKVFNDFEILGSLNFHIYDLKNIITYQISKQTSRDLNNELSISSPSDLVGRDFYVYILNKGKYGPWDSIDYSKRCKTERLICGIEAIDFSDINSNELKKIHNEEYRMAKMKQDLGDLTFSTSF
jgi:hypothetical protein